MIKLIAMDLDGTLLRSDKTISKATKDALQACQKKGVRVIYATGRGGSAERRAPKEMFDGRIIMNGAAAHIGDERVYYRMVKMELARELLLKCDERGLKTTAELSGIHYSNFDVSAEWSEIRNFKIVDFRTHDIDAEKLYAIAKNKEDVEFISAHIPKGLYLTVSNEGLAQVMHCEATKSNAIAVLARRWGIADEEIAAFGDDLNDIDMLERFGRGVAMGNAVDAVKDVADEVCDTNDDDGIAKWLLKNVL